MTQGSLTEVPDKETFQKVMDAWCSMEPAQPARIYAKDPGLLFFDMTPMKYTGFEEFVTGVQTLFLNEFQSGKAHVNDDARMYASENMAFGTATVRFQALRKNGETVEMNFRCTLVWEKRDDEWLVVHEHTSVPVDSAAPGK